MKRKIIITQLQELGCSFEEVSSSMLKSPHTHAQTLHYPLHTSKFIQSCSVTSFQFLHLLSELQKFVLCACQNFFVFVYFILHPLVLPLKIIILPLQFFYLFKLVLDLGFILFILLSEFLCLCVLFSENG